MIDLANYLPQDRRRALARGESLPDRTSGSALFADISGFTSLTEHLTKTLGTRRGAEELTKHLDAVNSALIAKVEDYGGSVIGFAGDSMLCWFDEHIGQETRNGAAQAPSTLAVACAFALQDAMHGFAHIALADHSTTELTLKVTIATGSARRFVIGDPEIRWVDALAGATIARTSTAEHLSQRGDVVVDEATAQALGDTVVLKEWREDHETHERFAVVSALTHPVATLPQASLDLAQLPPEELHPWLPKALTARDHAGQGMFLTEFRPCVALFVRFLGIDYDSAEAGEQLDAFICQTQSIATRYDGMLLSLTIGDKGSYAYLNFGAVSAHEDDARRALKVALEVRDMAQQLGFLAPLQMGVAQGALRVGATGGPTRKTFDAMGDEVNLSARLMTNAAAGEILVSGPVHKAVENRFVFEPRPPLQMKGKAEPLPVLALKSERRQRAIRLQEPNYALPMVGRQQELQIIGDKLDLAMAGQAQVIGIVAEAGLGKSRLVAEATRLAHKKGFVGYGGACQSDGVNTPYLTWKTIWAAFFDVDPAAPLRKQMRLLEGEIEDRAPSRVQAMPLLNVVLDLAIPENEFTTNLEPPYRKSALRALFEDCLRAAAQDEPLLLVLEDAHWIDALSQELLDELAKALSDCAICFVVAYRPPQTTGQPTPRFEALPTFARIELHELNRAESELAIRAKLAQLYPARAGALPPQLVDQLMARAQGNPFYLEELLNYLRDRGLDPRDPADLERIELPDSLHTLVLSRIDQLSEREKTTLRVASIVGRLFRAAWLPGYYPALGDLAKVKVDLDRLHALDITLLDTPEPDLSYLFKHIATHEVTYQSLPFGLRGQLHNQLARFLENQVGGGLLHEASMLDTLVFHFTRGEDQAKQRTYLKKAGDAASAMSAFKTSVNYYARLLELTPEGEAARAALALQLAEAHRYLGDFPAARAAIVQAQSAALSDADRAAALALLADISSDTGDHAEAQRVLAEAVPLARASGDRLTLCRTLSSLGANHWRLGRPDEARAALEESLALARELGDVTRELLALTRLGAVAGMQGDLAGAERLMREVHTRAAATGNRGRAMTALNNLGSVAHEGKDYTAARDYFAQALHIAREIGAQSSIGLYLNNLANMDIVIGEHAAARTGLREGLALAQRLGALPSVLLAMTTFALLARAEGQTDRALTLYGLARRHPAWSKELQRSMEARLAEWALDPAVVEAGLAKGADLKWDATIQELLKT